LIFISLIALNSSTSSPVHRCSGVAVWTPGVAVWTPGVAVSTSDGG